MWNRLRCMLTQRLNRTMGKNDINIEEMQKMIRQGATLVDVRSPQEYKEGHLKKANLIPEYEIIKPCVIIKKSNERRVRASWRRK